MTAPNEIFDSKYFFSLFTQLEKCESEAEIIQLLELNYSEFEYEQKALPWTRLMLYYFGCVVTDPIMGHDLKAGYKNLIDTTLLDWEATAQRIEGRKIAIPSSHLTAKPEYSQILKKLFVDAKQTKCIHVNSSESVFVSIWEPDRKIDTKIKWIESKKSCVGFMQQVTQGDAFRATINTYFEQCGINTKTGKRVSPTLTAGDMSNPSTPQFMDKYKPKHK